MPVLPLLALLASFHVDYATYLGGSIDDLVRATTVDSAGNLYVTGSTDSPNFPLTSTAYGAPTKGNGCAFVTKLNPGATAVVWSICLTGMISDAIALDAAGNVYVLEHTNDPTAATASSIIKFAPGSDHIIYSKALGDYAPGLTVDSAGNAYAVGSAAAEFVTTPGVYQPNLAPGTCGYGLEGDNPGPCTDAFVMKLSPDGSTAWATFLGGSGPDGAVAVAVDSQGNVWITGATVSPNFPVTPNAWQSTFHGEVDIGPERYGDAFVAELNATGAKLLYSTYLGGSEWDTGFAIAVDSAGAAYVGGLTQSLDFPITPGALQSTFAGIPESSAFVTKFSAAGSVVYSIFAPGPEASQIMVDAQSRVYIPSAASDPQGKSTAFSVIAPDGSALLKTVPVAGWMALDPQGSVYAAANSLGYVFFPTPGALQSTFGGGTYDVAITKLDFSSPPSPFVAAIVNAANLRSGTPQFYQVFQIAPGEIITLFGAGFDSTTRLLFDGTPAPVVYMQANQINAVVPFEVNSPYTAITLQGAGQTFGPGRMQVFGAVPGLFTADGSGVGQAAVLNQDGSLNSASNPAARGSTISVFMTGAGLMTPRQQDGSITPLTPPFPMVALGVSCSLGQVTYAGAAPGLIAGAVQVNVQISQNVTVGPKVPFVIYIGNYVSAIDGGANTIAVR